MKTSILSVVVMLAASCAASAAQPKKPNILFIVADDLGYADLGFQGCHDIPTPNIDALATSGVRFTSGYVSGPYCSPTRAGLMTGRYQTRFGHEFNPGDKNGLPLGETTIADRLKAAGYVTGLVGKWHLGSLPQFHPQKRGFAEFFGFLAGAHDYFRSAGILRGTEPVENLDYTTDAFAREAEAFIERHKAEPWFLYLAFNAVHTPMQATDDRLAKFPGIDDKRRRTYDAMTLALDEAVGSVLRKLASAQLAQNTLVVFISDNGGPTMPGTTINGSRNTPLRGSKRTTLEGGIRVPFVVSWPSHLKPAVCEQPVIQLDAHVTALAVAGVDVNPEWKLDGVNLLPFLHRENPGMPHEALYWRFGSQMAIRMGDYKLVRYDMNADTRTGRPRQPVTRAKLYRLSDDIGETKDLAAEMPERVQELQSKWEAWNATLAAPLWGNAKRDDDGAEPGAPVRRLTKAR
jgi:arylsulfatase A-like enzyme